MGIEAVCHVLGDQMPGTQGTDEDGVMPALAHKTNIVRKCCRHPQLDAALRRFPAHEIGFHLDIAVAQQNYIEGFTPCTEIVQAI